MTLKIHISDHNDDLHNTTAKRNLAGGVVGLQLDSKIDSNYLHNHLLTEVEFRTNPGIGTALVPERLNDNNTALGAVSDVINEYIQVDLDDYALIKEFRHIGSALNNGSGRWKIQHLWGTTWVDNTIDIPTRNLNTWTAWIPLTAVVITKGIRVVATTIDTEFNANYNLELEIRG